MEELLKSLSLEDPTSPMPLLPNMDGNKFFCENDYLQKTVFVVGEPNGISNAIVSNRCYLDLTFFENSSAAAAAAALKPEDLALIFDLESKALLGFCSLWPRPGSSTLSKNSNLKRIEFGPHWYKFCGQKVTLRILKDEVKLFFPIARELCVSIPKEYPISKKQVRRQIEKIVLEEMRFVSLHNEYCRSFEVVDVVKNESGNGNGYDDNGYDYNGNDALNSIMVPCRMDGVNTKYMAGTNMTSIQDDLAKNGFSSFYRTSPYWTKIRISTFKSKKNLSSTSTSSLRNNISNPKPFNEKNNSASLIGGLQEIFDKIVHWITTPIPKNLPHIKPINGILLHGPPGTGKTMLAKAICHHLKFSFFPVNGPELMGQYVGEGEKKLRDLFVMARDNAPSIIFLDEMESICPKRENSGEAEKRMVATLLTLMDGSRVVDSNNGDFDDNVATGFRNFGVDFVSTCNSSERVIVLGATNRPNDIDEALRRPGRLDKEIEIGIPNSEQRLNILKCIINSLDTCLLQLSDSEFGKIADCTHGYVGADLNSLVREALLMKNSGNTLPGTSDFDLVGRAMKIVRPSAMREISLEIPKVKWSDIGGYEGVKLQLKQSVEWPITHAKSFQKMGISAPRGVLLYGPPGCSKTLMAKALATEAKLNFLAVKGPELFNQYVGESEKAIRSIFSKARAASPSILFFDEIDAIGLKRGGEDAGGGGGGGGSVSDRVLTQILNEMDGIEPLLNVTVVAATNRPDMLDSALLRPGRLDRLIYIGLPDFAARLAIIQIATRNMPISHNEENGGNEENQDNVENIGSFSEDFAPWLADATEGYTGAEICALVQQAGLYALEEDLNCEAVRTKHFERAITSIIARTSPETLEYFETFASTSKNPLKNK